MSKLLRNIKTVMELKGFSIYTDPYRLNIVGIRGKSKTPNRFDDTLHVFFNTPKGETEHHVFPITTDPGTYWLNNPMMPQGTAILKEGQYRNAYSIGLHRGQYAALVQSLAPVVVLRDYNRDAVLDYSALQQSKGYFGINIHRAMKTGTTTYVDKHSAGCQVFSKAEQFDMFMLMALRHKKLYGNAFTYTLVDTKAVQRVSMLKLAIGFGITALLAFLLFPYLKRLFSTIEQQTQENFTNGNTKKNKSTSVDGVKRTAKRQRRKV